MPIFEYKTTITAKKKKEKEQNEKNLGQPTLPLYTLLRVYNITTKCWQIFFANFWQFHFCQLISTTSWTFFPNPQDFWVLLYLEPSYKMPSCNVWKTITKTKFGNLFELFFLSHKICLNSCHDFQSSLPHTILWDEFFPFLFNMNETE